MDELELAVASHEHKIRRMFVDPLGVHILVLVQQGLSVETMYIDRKFGKPRVISKLKGVYITSVGWSSVLDSGNLKNALLGTDAGEIYSLSIVDGRKEQVEVLGVIEQAAGPVAGLAQIQLSPQENLLFVLCGTHLHLYPWKEGTQSCLSGVGEGVSSNVFDLPIEQGAAQLQLLRPVEFLEEENKLMNPTNFAVLSTSGIYYGKINMRAQSEDLLDRLEDHKLLPSTVFNGTGPERPISIALTQYHFVLLYPSKLQFINTISKEVVQEILLESFASPMRGASALPLGLSRDTMAGELFILAGDDIFEIDCTNEDKEMWKIYLKKGDYSSALPYCRNPHQRNAAYLQEAERLLHEGNLVEAGTLYGKCTANRPSFEEISLKLMDKGNSDAVQAFLESKLETLGREDRIQSTMVSTWLLELLLDKANRTALQFSQNSEHSSSLDDANNAVTLFLTNNVRDLDPRTTVSLLQGYGRENDLISYARARDDHESELEFLVQQGKAERALDILRKPSVAQDLAYKYAPSLMALAPSQTVYAWMNASPPLDAVKILPALLPYADPGSLYSARIEAIRFLKFCISVRGITEPAIHDFNIAILSIDDENEDRLLEHLKMGRDVRGAPFYDPVRALRLCQTRGKKAATVFLLAEVGMWVDAIKHSLSLGIEHSVTMAQRYDGDDEHVQKQLWLTIVEDLVSSGLPDNPDDKVSFILC